MKTLTLLAALCFLFIPALAQEQDKPMPDRWHGLILDQSTPDDAVKVLGKPTSDKVTKARKQEFRTLKFKKQAGMSDIALYFQADKLVVIQLKPAEKIEASALPNIYGIEFDVIVSGLDEAVSPQDYERHQGKVYALIFL